MADGSATYKLGEKRNLFARFPAPAGGTLTVVGTPTFELFGPGLPRVATVGYESPVNVDSFTVGTAAAIIANLAVDTTGFGEGTYFGEFRMQATVSGGVEIYTFIATVKLEVVRADE